MGYRFSIGLVVNKEHYDLNVVPLLGENEELAEFFNEADESLEKDGFHLWYWDSTKITDEIEEQLKGMLSNHYNTSMLIMIGDDNEDITTIGWCDSPFKMGLVRKIVFENDDDCDS